MLQLYDPPDAVDAEARWRGMVQGIVFNFITLMLFACYIRCILVHPGEVPSAAPWLYTTLPGAAKPPPPLQEQKKTGERRHCKW